LWRTKNISVSVIKSHAHNKQAQRRGGRTEREVSVSASTSMLWPIGSRYSPLNKLTKVVLAQGCKSVNGGAGRLGFVRMCHVNGLETGLDRLKDRRSEN
jgi:hypothetical protein